MEELESTYKEYKEKALDVIKELPIELICQVYKEIGELLDAKRKEINKALGTTDKSNSQLNYTECRSDLLFNCCQNVKGL